ncbi:MAG TPA: hypothetical protein VIM53_01010 [Candidatus Saccharimonadales bacterium]
MRTGYGDSLWLDIYESEHPAQLPKVTDEGEPTVVHSRVTAAGHRWSAFRARVRENFYIQNPRQVRSLQIAAGVAIGLAVFLAGSEVHGQNSPDVSSEFIQQDPDQGSQDLTITVPTDGATMPHVTPTVTETIVVNGPSRNASPRPGVTVTITKTATVSASPSIVPSASASVSGSPEASASNSPSASASPEQPSSPTPSVSGSNPEGESTPPIVLPSVSATS